MTREMPKNFNFSEAEPRLYKWWEEHGWFKPEVAGKDAEPFVIAIPPPNVTGEPLLRPAIFVRREDLMIRVQRMRGKACVWIPGTDHSANDTPIEIGQMPLHQGT